MSIRALETRRNLAGTNAEFETSLVAPLSLVVPEVFSQDGVAQKARQACSMLDNLNRAWKALPDEARSVGKQALLQEESECSAELASQIPTAMDHAPLPERLSYADEGTPSRAECQPLIEEDAANIRSALEYISWRVEELPLSGRLVQEVHGIVLDSVRYDKATPGWFRTSPVWMGNPNSNIGEAMFVAPNVEDMADAWRELERQMNVEMEGSKGLVSVALEHYQFETIHPFLDGNGRTGRIVTIQSLAQRGLIKGPVLPISWALEQDMFAYFTGFLSVQQQNDYRTWVLMFLDAVELAAKHAKELLQGI
ncbi:MAG: Fic family protein [Coriobacteriales bacterium]|jgi:fido (protein-threonine AMPylation protein)